MKTIEASLQEYARGLIGGLLFSLPMLYTMEMWWAGFIVSPVRLIVYLITGLFILLVYNHYVGIRKSHRIWEGIFESIEEMGIGLLLTVFILWLTQRIAPGMSLEEIVGKTIVEAVTVAIGISVGKTQLGNRGDDDSNEDEQRSPHLYRGIGVALCGALLVSSNIAPTEEVIVIALEAPVLKIIFIAILSMILAGVVLYYSNFTGSSAWVAKPKSLYDMIFGTFMTYTVALVSSAFLLWFFNRFEGIALYGMVAETVTLSFPSALGASAGRLLIQS